MLAVPTISIVLASPGDVKAERQKVNKIVHEIEKTVARPAGVHLDLRTWETDASPGFHEAGPQGLIDPVLRIGACDIFVGIFWKRFGTPDLKSKSGTEHEFLQALKSWHEKGSPRIMFYFCDRQWDPKNEDERKQIERVRRFKRRFPKEGLWWSYATARQFGELMLSHLSSAVHDLIGRHERDRTTALKKTSYVKLLRLSRRESGGKPASVRAVERLDDSEVPVYDEALFMHVSIFPEEQSRFDCSFRSTGVVDGRMLIPWMNATVKEGPEVDRVPGVISRSITDPSRVYVAVVHHINGLQPGNENIGLRMDRFTRDARLVVDFSSLSNWRVWLRNMSAAVYSGGKHQASVPVEELEQGIFTCSGQDIPAGSVLRIDLQIDWDKLPAGA